MSNKMTFTASGDALIMKHLPKNYPGFQEVADFVGRAEARFTNLEATLSDYDCYASSFSGGTWLTVEPSILDDLASYGFNAFGWANNHTLDYSYGGLVSTKNALDKAGVAHAGAGLNLYEAARPCHLDLPSGRVAFISICSTFDPSARAGASTQSLLGRPGLNPLRYSTEYRVLPEHIESLKELAKVTHINADDDVSVEMGFSKPAPEGCYRYDGALYREIKDGEKEGRFSKANIIDVERTTAAITDALLTCDYAVVMIHSHEIKTNSDEEADYFLEEFSRACIDAGASAIFGGGTHQLKGIEIYKEKPIFYSLGNFLFQNEYVKVLPADYMEKHGLPATCTASEGIAARTAAATGVSMHARVPNFRSVIPFVEFDGGKLSKIEMLPIELGMGKPNTFKNIPYPANEEISQEIFAYLKRVSEPYGTKFEMKNGLIEVKFD